VVPAKNAAKQTGAKAVVAAKPTTA
jgi:hypothetical protein